MNKRILIIGDIMLDTYHFGKVERISPEAPVPVFLETGRVKNVPGGAANVAVNIAAIGVETSLCSVVGNDENGKVLSKLLSSQDVLTDYVLIDEDRMTTTKLRYIGPNNQQIMRADTEVTDEVSERFMDQIIGEIERNIASFGLVLLSDYSKGFLSEKFSQAFIKIAKMAGIPVLIDVKEKNLDKYKGATLLKPNRKELSVLSGMPAETKEQAIAAAVFICKEADAEYVLTTLGADGMILVNRDGLQYEVKSTTKEVFDVTGAGDTSIAYLAAEMVKGTEIKEAVKIANYAAGVQVSKVGTSIVYPDEVFAAMQEDGLNIDSSILDYTISDGLGAIKKAKEKGRKIVFTNGCFDILHAGHVSYLREAKKLGDILVIGLNSDDSIKRLKGNDRPINSLEDRETVLLALGFVDYVVPFDTDTPLDLIKAIMPDVLVKGGDYKAEDIVGAKEVISNGGEVKVLDFVPGKSTTGIIEKMRRS